MTLTMPVKYIIVFIRNPAKMLKLSFCLFFRSMMPKALDGQIVMEKTPRYFVTAETPARVHAMSRDVKLIVVVRDPVTRAISDYTQIASKTPGITRFESLAFKNRSSGQVDSLWSPLYIGLYAQHLERWLAYFPLSQIHFVSGERLVSDPAFELGRVQDFLGLERIITDKHFYFNKTKGFPCLKKAEGSAEPHCLGKTKGRTHVRVESEVIHNLRDFYHPHNLRFYQMTGMDFGWKWSFFFSPSRSRHSDSWDACEAALENCGGQMWPIVSSQLLRLISQFCTLDNEESNWSINPLSSWSFKSNIEALF